jgi:hypothetical protein
MRKIVLPCPDKKSRKENREKKKRKQKKIILVLSLIAHHPISTQSIPSPP